MPATDQAVEVIHQVAEPISGSAGELDGLVSAIGKSRLVLIGEASHGTHEFYEIRARITRRLLEEGGFGAVIAEADWPDAWRVNRYVRGFEDDLDADMALSGFKRFPQWMWRNTVVREFVEWLRDHNEALPARSVQCGFYGMDLYSLHASAAEVIKYLDRVDPEAGKRARYRYGCFEHPHEDPQAYGYAAGFDLGPSCEKGVIEQLVEMRKKAGEYASRDGRVAEDEQFYAEQNARVVHDAERYYREMFAGRVSSWNLRDTHMVDTVDALVEFLDKRHPGVRVVIWAHNSHLGDARATEMGDQGEVNVGQLIRERHGAECFNIGFSTHTGSVTAASNWDAPAERKRVRPSLPGSYERLFHDVGMPAFWLNLRQQPRLRAVLPQRLLQRAIGVIYLPQSERMSHYFEAEVAKQFDAIIHIDQTQALEPLERTSEWNAFEVPETYPAGV